MTHPLIAITLGVAVAEAFIALLRWFRTVGVRRKPRVPRPVFQPTTPGTCWHVCDDVACGHMTTRWIPAPGGGLRCEHAARHRGAVHLTHATDTTRGTGQ